MAEQPTVELLNRVLKDLFYKILRLQERNVSLSSNQSLSRTEMHVLENVQEAPDMTLTDIAEELGVTKATVSVTIARLERKGFLQKVRMEEDRRKKMLRLTEQGLFCYHKHRQFHVNMVNSILHEFRIEEHPHVIKSLGALLNFFDRIDAKGNIAQS
jgi:DNA-binding MarR family transcriptional regulator